MRLSALADEYELAVDEGAAQFRSLFENSTLGVAITNSAFRFLTANPTDDARLLTRRTATADVPRYLY